MYDSIKVYELVYMYDSIKTRSNYVYTTNKLPLSCFVPLLSSECISLYFDKAVNISTLSVCTLMRL